MFCGLQRGEKNYLRLFDFIAEMEMYEEEKIKNHFQDETFVKSLHVTKNYLYHLVLKSLRSFHAQHNVEQKIHDFIADVVLLEKRGLYNQAKDALQKAKKLAYKHHRYYYLVYLLRKETSYLFSRGVKNLDTKHENLKNELKEVNRELHQESQIISFYHQIYWGERTGRLSNEEIAQFATEWNAFLETFPQENLQSFYSNYWIENIQSNLANQLGDAKKRFDHAQKVVELWRKQKHMIESEAHIYKICLANYLHSAFLIEKWEVFPSVIKELKGISSSNFNEEAETFQNITFFGLLYFLNTQNFENALHSLAYITKGIRRYQEKMHKSRELAFYYNISILYFMLEDYDNALFWANKILNQTKTDHRKDIQRFSALLQLFYHYELGNYDLLDSLVHSTKRKLNRQFPITEFEELLLRSIKKLIVVVSEKEMMEEFYQFKKQLEVIPRKRKDMTILGYDEIQLWLEKKTAK